MRKPLLVIALAGLFATQAIADNSKIRIKEEINISPNSTIHINIPVGEFILDTHSSNTIELNVEVSSKNNGWFSSEDVSDTELSKRIEDKHVYLQIDKEDSTQEWVISIPVNANLDLDMGVGEAHIENVQASLNIDVGVGEVELKLSDDNYALIDLDAGVGEVNLRGFDSVNHKKHMVSESLKWHGKGEHEIEVDVGVGEVDIRR